MMQSLSGTTSIAPSTSFHLAGPSSLSQSLPAFFAQASRFLPSKSTTAPAGGGAPSGGGGADLVWSSALAGTKFPGFSCATSIEHATKTPRTVQQMILTAVTPVKVCL